MAGLSPTAGRELKESGNYSDLTITCKGTTWKLHKAIVLTHSDYLKAALAGNFDGGATSTHDFAEQDPQILDSVFEWMYTGEYNRPQSLDSLNDNGTNEMTNIEEEESANGSEAISENDPDIPVITLAELSHRMDVAVCACADFLMIEECRKAVFSPMLPWVLRHYEKEWFSSVLRELCETTSISDKIIRRPIFQILLDNFNNIKDVVLKEIIKEQEPLAYHIASTCQPKVAELQTDNVTALARIEKLRKVETNAADLTKVLTALRSLILDTSAECKSCRADLKMSYGTFTVKTTQTDSDGQASDRTFYYVECQKSFCTYRRYLN